MESFMLWKLLRQRLARMCRLILPDEEGQTIDYVMYGQVNRRGLNHRPRMIVVTRNHVWVIRVGRGWEGAGTIIGLPLLTPPKEVLAQLPRETHIGPLDSRGRTTINGESILIARRYRRDVEAADSATARR
jgi:hypothetical protein